MKTAIAIPSEQITKFCQHWQIIKLALFGEEVWKIADGDIPILLTALEPLVPKE